MQNSMRKANRLNVALCEQIRIVDKLSDRSAVTFLVKFPAIPTLSPAHNNASDSIAYLRHTINNRSLDQRNCFLNSFSLKFYSET